MNFGVYLSPDMVTTTALILGVWTLLAIALGYALGKAIALADERAAESDAQWLPDWVDEHDTTEIVIPREWFTRSTFEDEL